MGGPPPEWEIKLRDVPDMGYYVKEGAGEICVRGPGVFKVCGINITYVQLNIYLRYIISIAD